MRVRTRVAALGISAAAILTPLAVAAAGPASAAPATPAVVAVHTVKTAPAANATHAVRVLDIKALLSSRRSSSVPVLLHANTAYGLQTHGVGGQLTVQDSGHTLFYVTLTDDGFNKVHVDNSQNCLEALSANYVAAEVCQAGNNQQKWTFSNAAPDWYWHVKGNSDYMAVAAATNGTGVIMNAGQGDIRWSAF